MILTEPISRTEFGVKDVMFKRGITYCRYSLYHILVIIHIYTSEKLFIELKM